MKNGDMTSMPIELSGFGVCQPVAFTGLTKREQFAMAAMQGMLSHSTRYKPRVGASENWHEAISEEAVEIADALLCVLDKEQGHE